MIAFWLIAGCAARRPTVSHDIIVSKYACGPNVFGCTLLIDGH